MAARMFDASQRALRISTEHLLFQRTRVVTFLNDVVAAHDQLYDAALRSCSPVLTDLKDSGWAGDVNGRRCHQILQRLETMSSDITVCSYLVSDMSAQLDEVEHDRKEAASQVHAPGAELINIDAHVVPVLRQELSRFAEATARIREDVVAESLRQHIADT